VSSYINQEAPKQAFLIMTDDGNCDIAQCRGIPKIILTS
jgi:hypothetical protein